MRHWDWDGMVEANRVRLIGLLAGLSTLLGSGPVVRRALWRRVLASLVPMESALRRLIFVLARDMTAAPPPRPEGAGAERRAKAGGNRGAAFRLTDRPRIPVAPAATCSPRSVPRVLFLGEGPEPRAPVPMEDDPVDCAALRRRIAAMAAALDDMPAQARRLARWLARGERDRRAGRWRRPYPFRSGRPPGHRAHGRGDADETLADCHDLAVRCLRMIETDGATAP